MTKTTLAYVGHSYHRVTGSTQFILDLLARDYHLSVVWDDAWQSSAAPLQAERINALRPDVVLFFQSLPSAGELRKVHCKRLFLVPMHDHIVGNPRAVWSQIRGSGLRIINFCGETHAFFSGLGYESRRVQYWPPPLARSIGVSEKRRIFFWARKRNIGWPLLKALLGSERPERLVFRAAADPGETLELPNDRDSAEYRIDMITGWLDKARYLELLASCDLFMSPRLYEGIGQSFLEAMSMGLAVIAPDNPTMNEYIQRGRNGYLYSPAMPSPLDFSGVRAIRAQALKDVAAGHLAWLSQEKEILAYLASVPKRDATLSSRLHRLLRK